MGDHLVNKKDGSDNRSIDVFSRFLAVLATVISVFTFVLQFIAHDSLSYIVSPSVSTTLWWPTDAYIIVTLDIFNTGNRPAALISANAWRIQEKLSPDQKLIPDAICNNAAATKTRKFALFPVMNNTTDIITSSVKNNYASVVKGSKMMIKQLTFSIYGNDKRIPLDNRDDVEGVACLDLRFADATGRIYQNFVNLGGIKVVFEHPKFDYVEPESHRGQLQTVMHRRRLELPF